MLSSTEAIHLRCRQILAKCLKWRRWIGNTSVITPKLIAFLEYLLKQLRPISQCRIERNLDAYLNEQSRNVAKRESTDSLVKVCKDKTLLLEWPVFRTIRGYSRSVFTAYHILLYCRNTLDNKR